LCERRGKSCEWLGKLCEPFRKVMRATRKVLRATRKVLRVVHKVVRVIRKVARVEDSAAGVRHNRIPEFPSSCRSVAFSNRPLEIYIFVKNIYLTFITTLCYCVQ
jgi:hypothetical protein